MKSASVKHAKTFRFAVALLILLLFLRIDFLAAQILIGDAALTKGETLTTEPMVGFRKFPKGVSIFEVTGEKAGIPADLFIESAKATTWAADELKKFGKNPSNANLADWYRVSASPAGFSKACLAKPTVSALRYAGRVVEADPNLVLCLTHTEINFPEGLRTFHHPVGGSNIEFLEVDQRAFQKFTGSYALVDSASELKSSQAYVKLSNASANINSLPLLNQSAKSVAGEVSFGRPVVYSANEKKLVLPESITSKSDVYWIELALTFRDINPDNLSELEFDAAAPPETSALELIPYRFDKETNVKSLTSSPDIKVEAYGAKVDLGKVFEQEISYKSLKPMIVASGLRESEFSWTLTGESVQKGSQRFVAVLQVPKRQSQIILQFRARAKTKRTFGFQGDIISTERPISAYIKFK